jgi:hypothetical protein
MHNLGMLLFLRKSYLISACPKCVASNETTTWTSGELVGINGPCDAPPLWSNLTLAWGLVCLQLSAILYAACTRRQVLCRCSTVPNGCDKHEAR